MKQPPKNQETEEHNLRQIKRLNQRGGRDLSIVDLIEDGTISAEMAALCWLLIERGSSLLTGAVPGGAGKTTLMASLLAFLPAGERIVTVEDSSVLRRAREGQLPQQATLLAHEIGSGRWFGYIWDGEAAEFFKLWEQGYRRVSCLHADDPDQTADQLRSQGVREEDLQQVGLQLYMEMRGGLRRRVRRVRSLHCRLAGRLREVYRWQPGTDQFELRPPREGLVELLSEAADQPERRLEEEWDGRAAALLELQNREVHRYPAVRRAISGWGL